MHWLALGSWSAVGWFLRAYPVCRTHPGCIKWKFRFNQFGGPDVIGKGPLFMKTVLRLAPALLAGVLSSAQPTSTPSNAISLAGSGYSVPSSGLAVAPGQVIVLQVYGVTTAINSPIVPVLGPNGYPLTLAGILVGLIQGKAATVTNLQLRGIYQTNCIAPCSPVTGITLQIPFELESNYAAAGDPPPQLRISQNGTVVGGVTLVPVTDNVHVLNTCDYDQIYISAAFSVPQNVCAAVVMGGAGIYLNSLYNLARGGDELATWVFGMGATTAPAANCCTSPDQLGKLIQPFLLNFDFRPNATASPAVPSYGVTAAPLFAAYVGGGDYQVNFAVPPVPAGLPECDGVKIKSNLTVTISGPNSYDAAQICVAVQ